jgi:hypothetical protein
VRDRYFALLRAPDDAGCCHRRHDDDHDQHEQRDDELVLLQHDVVESEHRYRDDAHLSDFHQHHLRWDDDEHQLYVLLFGHCDWRDDIGMQQRVQHSDRVEHDIHVAHQQLLLEYELLGIERQGHIELPVDDDKHVERRDHHHVL